jgi:hypothetical protein
MRSSAGSWLDLGTGRFTGQEQSVGAVLPRSCVLSPAAQGVHAPSPTQFLNSPATHGAHAVPFAPWLPSCKRERSQEMRVLPARCQTAQDQASVTAVADSGNASLSRTLHTLDHPLGWARRGRHRAAAVFDLRAPPPGDRDPGTLLLKPAGGQLWSRPLRSGLLGLFRVSGFGFWVSGFGFWVLGFWFRVSGFGFRVSG